VLEGLKPGPLDLAFSSDGKQLVTRTTQADKAEQDQVWDVSKRAEIAGATASAPRGSRSPDGLLQAVRAADGVIEIWNTTDNTLRHRLLGHLADVPGLAFFRDGRRLVSASRDGTLRVWDPREGIEVYRMTLENDFANDVAVSSDGSLIACATQQGTVRVWDARLTGDTLRLKGHAAPIDAYGFTTAGKLLSRDEGGKIIAWSLPEGIVLEDAPTIDPSPLPATSPDGKWSVDSDRRDRAVLAATRRRQEGLPFDPWREETEFMARQSPRLHVVDAKAAESRGDWFAAAFHLAAALELAEDAGLRERLEHACTQLEAEQKGRPRNAN
jgi:WD40 repeat protein